ncbi:MAG TPA: 4Fe-4S binding protein [Clostridiales bacterium]|nr:4Fe-4S binding protein [Clostridiales bacterium]HQH62496.1 4Fe-4S binding protein [Clostridiales bacterium]HQK72997.1 4Fe-4S binding protein [Clostridiales bacterium]
MGRITDKDGELKLSVWKIFVMFNLVVFFTAVAKTWEHRRRREFHRAVQYKKYDTAYCRTILEDFKALATCKDPYIEHFYEKHPDFAGLHKLWVLNSSGYWAEKIKKYVAEQEHSPYSPPQNKAEHRYPTSKKLKALDKLDYRLVNYFGNYCEFRSLDFFLWWGEKTTHKTFGRLAKRLFDWFTRYYAGYLVPADHSLGRGVEVMPYENIVELVKRVKVGQIWPCSCKSFRKTADGVPRDTCMLISEVASLDDSVTKYPDTGFMPAGEVLAKLKECEDFGLIHQIMCVSAPAGRKMYVLCNCDNRGCVPMFLKVKYGIPMVKGSGFVCEQKELEKCTACGVCAARCQLGAIRMEDGKPVYDESRCLGCGLCVTTCPAGVRKMVRKPTEPFHDYTVEQIKKHPERTLKT